MNINSSNRVSPSLNSSSVNANAANTSASPNAAAAAVSAAANVALGSGGAFRANPLDILSTLGKSSASPSDVSTPGLSVGYRVGATPNVPTPAAAQANMSSSSQPQSQSHSRSSAYGANTPVTAGSMTPAVSTPAAPSVSTFNPQSAVPFQLPPRPSGYGWLSAAPPSAAAVAPSVSAAHGPDPHGQQHHLQYPQQQRQMLTPTPPPGPKPAGAGIGGRAGGSARGRAGRK